MPYSFSFTVTQVVNNFTATVSTPLALALTNVPNSVAVTSTSATVFVNNAIQPVTISGGGASQTFNQSLNTTDSVSFANVTTPSIYGTGGAPVSFPTGINAANFGTVFSGSLDFGQVFGTYTNILSLLFAAIPLDFGTIVFQPQYSVDLGTL
jgi:hypothetical protein